MSWIESHDTLRDHPKRKRLSRLLGLDVYATIGLLNCLWWWAMDYAPDGDLSRYDPFDVADGIDYPGDPDELMAALREAGFLDDMQLHDWDEYGEKLYRRRLANAERMRQARAQKTPENDDANTRAEHVQNTCNARAGHVQSERTGQDRTGQDIEITHSCPSASDGLADLVADFHAACPSLPRVRQLTQTRKQRLARLRRELGDDGLRELFRRVEASDFLTGRQGGRGWRADFDWITKPEHVTRILEGAYDNRATAPPRASPNVARALALVQACEAEEANHGSI